MKEALKKIAASTAYPPVVAVLVLILGAAGTVFGILAVLVVFGISAVASTK